MKRSLDAHGRCYSCNDVVLQVTGLYVMRVACNKWHVFAFLILKADLPAV